MYVFGELLKQFRVRQSMEQQELAEQLGVHRNTIIAWEHSENLPRTRQKVLELAKALYLDEEDTDHLLFAANYPLEYQTKATEKGSHTQIKAAHVKQMFVEHLEVVSASTTQPASTRCDFYVHIPFPPNYVERIEVLASARAALLSDVSSAEITSQVKPRLSFLHGMGGIGKTSIARALCDDPAVQAAFPDGILWVTLGKAPELIPKIREWVSVVGGTISENAPTVDSLKNTLTKLLKDRTCLLIVDDVWRVSHAEAFLGGGMRCRYLLTTRKAEIATKLNASVLPTPLMTEAEAVALLEMWAKGCLAQTDPALNKHIVKQLEYLPLAIKLAGAQLQRIPLDKWFQTFDVRTLKFLEVEHPHDSLELTFELSLEELDEQSRQLYTALAIFKEDSPTPQVGIERLWQGLGNLDAQATRDLLDNLASRALLDLIPYPSTFFRAVQLHDLLHDLVSSALGDKRIAAHRALLDAYKSTQQGIGWHTAQDDGYLYDHLAYHFQAAGAVDELKGLFADQNWMKMRVPQGRYTYDGYLDDLSLALKCAEAETRQQIEIDQEPEAFADCMRFVLIRTSINSIAGNFEPQLVARAVEIGLWPAHRALSVAARIPDAVKKTQMYLELLKTGGLSHLQRKQAQLSSLEAALEIPDKKARADALVELMKRLTTGELQVQALERAFDAALSIENAQDCIDIMAKLTPMLTGDTQVKAVVRAWEVAQALDAKGRVHALDKLAPYLPDKRLEKALEETLRYLITDVWEWELEEFLEVLEVYLTDTSLAHTLDTILALEDEYDRARALRAFAPYLTRELSNRAWQSALTLTDEEERLSTLAVVKQDEDDREESETVLALLRESRWVESLLLLLVDFSGELGSRIAGQALEATLTIEDEQKRVELLSQLLERVNGELRAEVAERTIGLILKREDEQERAQLLSRIVRQLTEAERLQVPKSDLEKAFECAEGNDRLLSLMSEMLSRPPSPPPLIEVVNEQGRTKLFWMEEGELIPYPTEGEEVWQEPSWLKSRLRDEEQYLKREEEKRLQELQRKLKDALAERDRKKRAAALTALASDLPELLIKQSLERAMKLTNREEQRERIRLLTSMAPYLRESLLKRGLEVVSANTSGQELASSLVAFLPYLEGKERAEILKRGLEAALTAAKHSGSASELTPYLPYITGKERIEVLERAIEAALQLDPMDIWAYRALFMKPIIFPLSEEKKSELEEAIDHFARVEEAIAGPIWVTGGQHASRLNRWLEVALAVAQEKERAALLATLMGPVEEERLTVLEQGFEAALQLGGAWGLELMMLAYHLKQRQLEQNKATSTALPQGEYREKPMQGSLIRDWVPRTSAWKQGAALVTLSPEDQVKTRLIGQLKDILVEHAMRLTLTAREGWARNEMVLSLSPYLSDRQRIFIMKHGLEAVEAISDEKRRALLIGLLAPQLRECSLLERVMNLLAAMTQGTEELKALIPQLKEFALLQQGLKTVATVRQEKKRVELLVAFAPHLKEFALLEEGLKIAWATADEWWRIHALAAFLPFVEDRPALLKSIKQMLVNRLSLMLALPRERLFKDVPLKELFTSFFYSSGTLNALAAHIIEICEEWHWI